MNIEGSIDADLSGITSGDNITSLNSNNLNAIGHAVSNNSGTPPHQHTATSTHHTTSSLNNMIDINIAHNTSPLPQANLTQKSNVLNYHNYQVSLNPKHKQSDTIKHFLKQNQFSISRSSLNRWISNESKIKEDALKLSSKSRSLTKVRKSVKPSMIKLQEFFEKNDKIIKCLEMYYIQNLLMQPNDLPIDKEILQKFNEFKILYDGTIRENELLTGTLIDNESWPQYFKNQVIKYQIDAIQDNLNEQANISKISKVLIQEKERLQLIFSEYEHENIYQFNDLIFDLDRLYNWAELSDSPTGGPPPGDRNEEFLLNELRKEYTVTLGILGNVTGSDFPKPLIISNLLGNSLGMSQSYNNVNNVSDEFHYDPEGFNRRNIFREYLHKWDTKLNSENRSVALLLDTHWSHFGLGEYRLQKFNNIKLVFINSKYDQTTSYYHRSQLRLPFSIGYERFLKCQLKMRLFKKFYKDTRVMSNKFEAFNDAIGIINNIKINYDILIEKIKSEPILKTFYRLGFDGSRLFESELLQMGQSTNLHEHHVLDNNLQPYNTDANGFIEEDSKSKNLYGRLTTFVRPLIPIELKTKLQFSDTTRKLIVKDYEQELYQFVKSITKATIKLNPKQEFDSSQLLSNLLREFTKGENERKFNKQYSMNAIVEYVKLTNKYELQQEEIKQMYKNNQQNLLRRDLEIDRRLLNEVQPFLYRSFIQGTNSSASDEPNISITEETFKLFNKFYAAYVNDTSIISNKQKHTDRRRKSPAINQNELLLQEQQEQQQVSRKRLKLNKFITESDRSEDERDLERSQLSFSPQKPTSDSSLLGTGPISSRGGSIFTRSLLSSSHIPQVLVNDVVESHHFVSSFLDSE